MLISGTQGGSHRREPQKRGVPSRSPRRPAWVSRFESRGESRAIQAIEKAATGRPRMPPVLKNAFA